MKKGTHCIDEKTFSELSYEDQARSLNAQILSIERALKAHIKRAQNEGIDVKETKEKYIIQLERLINGLK
jgi:hypothetical protein